MEMIGNEASVRYWHDSKNFFLKIWFLNATYSSATPCMCAKCWWGFFFFLFEQAFVFVGLEDRGQHKVSPLKEGRFSL